jgi:hypothetical protein
VGSRQLVDRVDRPLGKRVHARTLIADAIPAHVEEPSEVDAPLEREEVTLPDGRRLLLYWWSGDE